MANREVDQFLKDQTVDTMPEEDVGHICIYRTDIQDRNFKICITCDRVVYRTNEEIMKDHGIILERKIRGIA